MKKLISLLALMITGSIFLTGCGVTADADTNTLFIGKDGKITEVSVGDFTGSNYDIDEFEQYVKDAIDTYDASGAAGSVKLKKVQESEGTAKLVMEYSDYNAYTAFVENDLFLGTVVQGLAAGYDFSADFYAVTEGQTDEKTTEKSDVISHNDYHVVITDSITDVSVNGTICYISGGVTLKDKSTATVTDTAETEVQYIIYK